ncbi:MAG TPA: metal-sensitive transcriptional regulator, partial [Anaerolineae bacterium]|nr:metal-sensitive transcriptional regulator [Anaerolineae bacterium]
GWGKLAKEHDPMEADQKRQTLNRLKSIEGHVRGIQRMVEDDTYCIDVIRQVHAVQKALEGVSSLVLENHLNTCVTTAIRGNDVDERQRMIGEIVGVFQETGKL